MVEGKAHEYRASVGGFAMAKTKSSSFLQARMAQKHAKMVANKLKESDLCSEKALENQGPKASSLLDHVKLLLDN